MEVPDPHVARSRRRAARDRRLVAGIPGGGIGALSWRALGTYSSGSQSALVAYVLLLAGLAAKIGWAPVHNWLPDAHSEAPPPVSALLSAALLPAVLLVAWRSEHALAPVIGARAGQDVLIFFGLVSLAVAIPFLWRSLPWKRLLAYSSLEHMGVIALGIGFGTPLALAGVAVHIAAHAVAKAVGFYAATPLLEHEPRAAERAVTGIARTYPALGGVMGISLGALAGLPPSPLFLSEVLIVAGGFQAGRSWAAAATALLLALGFLGLAHALLETTVGKARRRDGTQPRGRRGLTALGGISLALLLGLPASRSGSPAPTSSTRSSPGSRERAGPTARRSPRRCAEGWRFAGLHATSDGARVRDAARRPAGATRLETVAAQEGVVPSIVDLFPAAGWDEREAHDLQGVDFAGHEPLRPLVDHDLRPRSLDGARARPRRVPGRRRADPRRDHRVGPLPPPRRRRAHPPPRRPPLLQAPRPRARSGRTHARGRTGLRLARLRSLRSRKRRRIRARLRRRTRPRA